MRWEPARWAAAPWSQAAAQVASNGGMPWASRPAMVPASTSPAPAVASHGGALSLMAARPSGAAMMVSAPFSSTTAPVRAAAARVAASLLAHIGLPELVCESLDQYRDTAIALCQDELALPSLRKRVATGKADSALFDGKRFAQHWQDLIERMVARQDAGLPPSSLAAA